MIAGTKADSLYMTGNPFPKAIGTKDKELFKIDAILRIPFAIIAPLIVVVCFVSAWTVSSSPFDLWLAFVFGLVSYLFKKCDYPIAPLVLAMVIGDKAEDAFRQSMIIRRFAGRLLVEIAVRDADDAWHPATALAPRGSVRVAPSDADRHGTNAQMRER
jgi:hypothetical protein